jgi:hypothetical protein
MTGAPTLLIAALLLASAPPPDPSPESRRHLELGLSADDKQIVAFHQLGDVKVRVAGPGEEPTAYLDLIASGDSKAAEEALLALVKLGAETHDGVTTVRSLFPDPDKKPPKLSLNATLTLVLPAGRALEIQNGYGNVTIAGAFGNVLVRNNMGSVEVTGARGAVRIFDSFNAVVARDCASDVVVEAKNCKVTLERIGGLAYAHTSCLPVSVTEAGSADVQTSLSPVDVTAIARSATVVAELGRITARRVGGNLAITGKNGAIDVEEVGGDLLVHQNFQSVAARRVHGNATIVGSLADTTLEDVDGTADVSCSNSPVRLVRCGKVVVQNSGRMLEIVEPRGDVQATANGGLLKLRVTKLAADDPARELTLVANGGAIELGLPADGSYALDATSTTGQLESEFPDMDITPQGTARVGSLRRGDGKAKLHATCDGGKIRVGAAGSK